MTYPKIDQMREFDKERYALVEIVDELESLEFSFIKLLRK
jgi:hypothetical protein